ncbi:protein ALP1-like [Ixodes scapularis]|uniref:protein ALP1-like n=1 Tax=Ixodes scapularis TaxID=6945 RepID=UPI001AD6675B|nr:protein ALP1-like [Ixodes scapularis]
MFRTWTSGRSKGALDLKKMDLEDLVAALKIPAEVKSAQRVRVPGYEALCMTLRRLAYPNRLCDLERTFGRHSSVISSVVSTVMAHIEYQFGHLLSDLTNHKWLDVPCLKKLSEAVHARGAPLKNCWGFIDGTARHICRPSVGQQEHFSGHKRHHVQKYQALMSANGIICQLVGPFNGRRHDAGILKDTALYDNLQAINHGERYVIYGDPAYPLRPLLLKPFGGSRRLPHEALFNKRMSTVRQAVEWGFGKVAADFAFVDFHKNQKMSRQRLGRMYKVATLLSNCHTCLYGSQVSNFFEVEAPALDDYLVPLSLDS